MPHLKWNRIEEVFQAALDVPACDRGAWLDERCGAEADLRAEVESLLAAEEVSADFLPRSGFGRVVCELLAEVEEGREGQQVGPYRIAREVGRGGMGVVYEASRADERFRQRVAVKVVKRGLDTEDILRRFRNERRILASLEHPNIARLYDGGETEDGLPYFVMEYVEGRPLLHYCDGRGLSLAERLRLFRRVCAAVQHAHQNLVVHLDLKPSNILITEDGEPKLLDFGVAKLLSPDTAAAGLTETRGMRMMTPEYASPERVCGRPITTATDIYSLGVILYELLTGSHPFTLKDASPEELSRVICDSEPAKPSDALAAGQTGSRAPGEVGRRTGRRHAPRSLKSLRGDLDNIVLKALRKEPERRYRSVEQFSEDIRRHLEGLPVVARKDTLTYRASKFVTRNRAGAVAAATVLVALIAGLVATAWQARVAARERDQARLEQAKAEQVNTFLQSILSAASPEEKGKDAKVVEVLNDAASRVDAEFADQPALKAQALLTIGQTYNNLGLPEESERALREALSLNAGLHGEENRETALSMLYLCSTLLDESKYDEAETLCLRSVATLRKFSPEGGKEVAGALQDLGEIYLRRGEYEKAKPFLRESVSTFDNILGARNADSAFSLISLGRVQQYSGDAAGAEATYRESVAIFRGLPPRYEDRLGTVLLNLGSLLAAKGDYDEGVAAMREAEGIFQKQGMPYPLFIAETYLCTAYTDHGDYELAKEDGERAVEAGRKLQLEELSDFIVTLGHVGLSLTRTGRAKEAEPLLRKSLERAKKFLPPASVKTPLIEGALGECLTAQGNFAEAEPLITHSYDALKASQGERSPLTTLAARRAVDLYDRWKKPDLAAEYRAAAVDN